MIAQRIKSSIGWRLQIIILGIVLVFITLCANIYYFKTRDNRHYAGILSNLSLANGLPQQVDNVVGDILLYQKNPETRLATRIFTAIDTSINIADQVLDSTFHQHEGSVIAARGVRDIIGNLERISRETIYEIDKGIKTIRLYENIDLLNILIEVTRKNVYRYVTSELGHANELKDSIARKNAVLGALMIVFIVLGLTFVLVLVAVIRKTIVLPIQRLEKGIVRYQENKGPTSVDVTSADEIGSLARAFTAMTSEVQARELALQESEQKYRLLADNANDVIFVLDRGLIYTYVSPSIGALLDFTPEEVIGNSLSMTLMPGSWDSLSKGLAAKPGEEFDGHRHQTHELEMSRKDGTAIWTEITFSYIVDEKKSSDSILGVVRNINDRKLAQQEQEQLQTQLIQAQKIESVGRLAGGVAHDFNNMLSIIIGNGEVALEELGPSHPAASYLLEILKAGERSTILTRQLLAFARRQTIAPKVIDLNQTVEAMISMLQRLIGEDISLSWLPENDLWPVRIDPSQVDQILANLCVNARDAIKDIGKVTIETDNTFFDDDYCQTHRDFRRGNYVMISVSDNGCGMEKETMAQLFEPFFTTKDVGKGTGLGLATVYGIVKQNMGFLHVYSELGEGTTFKIYLPKHGEVPEYEPPLAPKVTRSGDETILVVEDEQAILDLTELMLKRMGYTVLAASTPGEAMRISEQAGKDEIQLLLTDVVMPEMNGRDLAKRLQRIHPNLKCLFMSGYTYNVIAHHGILEEALSFINKPFSIQELSAKLREVFDLMQAKG